MRQSEGENREERETRMQRDTKRQKRVSLRWGGGGGRTELVGNRKRSKTFSKVRKGD